MGLRTAVSARSSSAPRLRASPATVLVVESWSDEATFYLFNDTEHEPVPGVTARSPNEVVRHGGRWPDPRALVDWLHERGIRPRRSGRSLCSRRCDGHDQHRRDVGLRRRSRACAWAPRAARPLPQSRLVVPPAAASSTSPTPAASRVVVHASAPTCSTLSASTGSRPMAASTCGVGMSWPGMEPRAMPLPTPTRRTTSRPTTTSCANTARQPVTFSRAGFTGYKTSRPTGPATRTRPGRPIGRPSSQASPRAPRASPSGAGTWPASPASCHRQSSTIQSTAMAAFRPIMQYHSEHNEHRQPLADRTPWNVAEHRGDAAVNEVYRFYARLRMNLVPYLCRTGSRGCSLGLAHDAGDGARVPGYPQAAAIDDQFLLGSICWSRHPRARARSAGSTCRRARGSTCGPESP